jgi:hypothetical protein
MTKKGCGRWESRIHLSFLEGLLSHAFRIGTEPECALRSRLDPSAIPSGDDRYLREAGIDRGPTEHHTPLMPLGLAPGSAGAFNPSG